MSGTAPVNHSVDGGDGFKHLRVRSVYHGRELGSPAATAVEYFALGEGTRTMERVRLTTPVRDTSKTGDDQA